MVPAGSHPQPEKKELVAHGLPCGSVDFFEARNHLEGSLAEGIYWSAILGCSTNLGHKHCYYKGTNPSYNHSYQPTNVLGWSNIQGSLPELVSRQSEFWDWSQSWGSVILGGSTARLDFFLPIHSIGSEQNLTVGQSFEWLNV